MTELATPMQDGIEISEYSEPSPPFTRTPRPLLRVGDLLSPGWGKTSRTEFFVQQVERILSTNNGFAPFCFRDTAGRTRCMDKACLKYVGETAQNIFEYVLDDAGYIIGLQRAESLSRDINEIAADPLVTATERSQLIAARIGQGDFRDATLALWDGRCAVTGSALTQAIRASHIVPWRSATNAERLDPENGLPLVATLDALFDCGLISFSATGSLLVRSEYASQIEVLVPLKKLRQRPSLPTQAYLRRHRQAFGFPEGE